MDYPVYLNENNVGTCTLEKMGLYWKLQCSCMVISDRVERLYCGERRLGVLDKEGDRLTLRRMISVSSCPELPPKSGRLTLYPEKEQIMEPWEGEILGYVLKGYKDADTVLIPYSDSEPCPCEPLMCYFEIKDGYWRIPVSPVCE